MTNVEDKENKDVIARFIDYIGCGERAADLVHRIADKCGSVDKFVGEMNTIFRGDGKNYIQDQSIFDDKAVLTLFNKDKECIHNSLKGLFEDTPQEVFLQNASYYGGENHGLSDDELISLLDRDTKYYDNERLALFATRLVMYKIGMIYGNFYQYSVDRSIYGEPDDLPDSYHATPDTLSNLVDDNSDDEIPM